MVACELAPELLKEVSRRRESAPVPCKVNCSMREWFAKLEEEVTEAHEAAVLYENGLQHKRFIADELTDVITVCTSFLEAIGYNEHERMAVQRRVNEKNQRRGYCSKAAL